MRQLRAQGAIGVGMSRREERQIRAPVPHVREARASQRGADIKALEDAVPKRLAATFCVAGKPVDAEGYCLVMKGPKPQQPQFGDFIRETGTQKRSTNWDRPLSLTEWQEIAVDVRGGSPK